MGVDASNKPYVDLVQVNCLAEGGLPPSFGSGLLVGRGVVLTALHCVAVKEQEWRERKNIQLVLWRDLEAHDVQFFEAHIAWPPTPRRNAPDFAILTIEATSAPQM